jgi:hypothetical protein
MARKLTDTALQILADEKREAQDYHEETDPADGEDYPPEYWDEWDIREWWEARTGRNTYPTPADDIVDFEPTPF